MTKATAVQKMFDSIAGQYDLMNKVMTLGQDQRWRRFVVAKAGDARQGRVLDLATGTGDIAALYKVSFPAATVVGGDFAQNMLAEARRRFSSRDISWQACDANFLPFADGVFEAVTFGYLLRNVDDAPAVLAEVYRVLKKGGRIVCLDTTPPSRNILYPFIRAYLRWGIPLMGRLIASDKAAYAYLTGSTMDFYKAEELEGAFRQAGFQKVGFKRFMMGTIAVHWGEK
ncbi:MAG: bifunctional demethylmenaquinone methyltransferase/2-methoxy-6-polyprenyl-1,4-benzoquinol methylase UbiE [Desulfurivibrionaceae bacterium]|nr:bifunctional demethylmenaquinone methyltransferase/2-methoxy-6-polyprenyl-1,4-benzoquinol methylase UbiE [Desulfurivibrionaceae bacterium]